MKILDEIIESSDRAMAFNAMRNKGSETMENPTEDDDKYITLAALNADKMARALLIAKEQLGYLANPERRHGPLSGVQAKGALNHIEFILKDADT